MFYLAVAEETKGCPVLRRMKEADGRECVMEGWSEVLESWLLSPTAVGLRTLHYPGLSYSLKSPSPLRCCFWFDYGDPPHVVV